MENKRLFVVNTICTGFIPTISPVWYIVDGLTVCYACVKNGCINEDQIEKFITPGPSEKGIISKCYCQKITEHSRENMDMCVGKHRINYGTWYVPKGKAIEKCSYCDWCVQNGCIAKTDVDIVKTPVKNCNCDCKAEHPHIGGICCPICKYNEPGIKLMICGSCVVCKNTTPYPHHKLCKACSYCLQLCDRCRLPIKTGDEYVKEITDLLNERIKTNNTKLQDLKQQLENMPKRQKTKNTDKSKGSDFMTDLQKKWLPMQINSMEAEIENYRQDLAALTKKYGGKNDQEILEMLLDKKN